MFHRTIIFTLLFVIALRGSVINSNPSVICDQQLISLNFLAEEAEDTRSVRTCQGVVAKHFYQVDHHASELPRNHHSSVGVISVLVDRKPPRNQRKDVPKA